MVFRHDMTQEMKKEVISVIETDAIKFELAQYESPLQEVRDSLWHPYQER